MPHVDEGLLHAYLDGALDALLEAGALPHGTTRDSIEAHLAVCDDCRALLEAERAIRTRAGAVLDAVAPVVDVPPFSDLFAASRARQRRRVWPLAWAASLLLAVGAGWWGSELFRNQVIVLNDEVSAPVPSALDDAPQSQRGMAEADTREAEAGAAQPPALVVPPDVQNSAADLRFRDAERAGGAARQLGDRARAAETRASDLAAAGVQPTAPAAEAARAQRSEDTRRAAVADTGRLAGRIDSIVVTAPPESLLRRPLAAAVQSVAVTPAAPPAPPPSLSRADERAAVGGARAADGSAEMFRQQLAEIDGGRVPFAAGAMPADLPLLQIEGGSPPIVQRGALIGFSLARITQRAPSGVDVELIVWRQSSLALAEIVVTGNARTDSAAARAQRQRTEAEVAQKRRVEGSPFAHTVVGAGQQQDGRNELLLRSGDGAVFVALRAHLPAAQLQALRAQLVETPRD